MELKVEHLSFSYGDHMILDDVSFNFFGGKAYVIVGPNGSGKSTLLNIISGLCHQHEGIIYLDSIHIENMESFNRSKLGIARTFQEMRICNSLTVCENIMLAFPKQYGERWYSSILHKKKVKQESRCNSTITEEILKNCYIDDISDSLASQISFGQLKLLNLACCIAGDSSIWLLDEPAAGINPTYRSKIAQIIKRERDKGKTMLIIEHNTDFISEVADEILFLNNAKLTHFSSYSDFKGNESVQNAYI